MPVVDREFAEVVAASPVSAEGGTAGQRPGTSIDRACTSGLMVIATAAKQIVVDSMAIAVGGGVESISLVRACYQAAPRARDQILLERTPALYKSMRGALRGNTRGAGQVCAAVAAADRADADCVHACSLAQENLSAKMFIPFIGQSQFKRIIFGFVIISFRNNRR
jgi:acetyl-CoA acetyltransferase